VYSVPDERRLQLDFHRNAVLHRYVAPSLVAAALRARGLDAREAEVKEEARSLSRLLKLEFMYRVGESLDRLFAENVTLLEGLGAVARDGDRLRPGADAAALEFLADLTRAYLESYRVAAETILAAGGADAAPETSRRGLVKAMLERGRAGFLEGRVAQREALSRPTFENAVEWFVEEGALVRSGEGLTLDAGWRADRLPRLIASIDRALR
jgi:glycerol-3-phosphate O-acyltransferase